MHSLAMNMNITCLKSGQLGRMPHLFIKLHSQMRRKQQEALGVCSRHVLLLLLLWRAAALQVPRLLQLPWCYQAPAKRQQVPQL